MLAQTWAFAAARAAVEGRCHTAAAAADIEATVDALTYNYGQCFEHSSTEGTSGATTGGDANQDAVRPPAMHALLLLLLSRGAAQRMAFQSQRCYRRPQQTTRVRTGVLMACCPLQRLHVYLLPCCMFNNKVHAWWSR